MTQAMAVRKQCHWCCRWTARPLIYVRIEHPEPSLDGRRATCAWLCWWCLDKRILKPMPQVRPELTDQRIRKLRRIKKKQVPSPAAVHRWCAENPRLDSSFHWRVVQMLCRLN